MKLKEVNYDGNTDKALKDIQNRLASIGKKINPDSTYYEVVKYELNDFFQLKDDENNFLIQSSGKIYLHIDEPDSDIGDLLIQKEMRDINQNIKTATHSCSIVNI